MEEKSAPKSRERERGRANARELCYAIGIPPFFSFRFVLLNHFISLAIQSLCADAEEIYFVIHYNRAPSHALDTNDGVLYVRRPF